MHLYLRDIQEKIDFIKEIGAIISFKNNRLLGNNVKI